MLADGMSLTTSTFGFCGFCMSTFAWHGLSWTDLRMSKVLLQWGGFDVTLRKMPAAITGT
jgi:hypothetical protein